MSNTSQSEFKFRRTDRIGAASAEDDSRLLEGCFVHTEEYEILKDIRDIRQIVLGRTGSGKSALFEKLKSDAQQHVISIDPKELALTYVSNSSVIRYFSDIGVNLDPFYKLLWRHVLTVEVLRKHFASHAHEETGGLWTYLMDLFSSKRLEDKAAKQAVEYLRRWGERFWVELEYRVTDITQKMENDLTSHLNADLRAHLVSGGAERGEKISLSEEQKIEVVRSAQRVVSKTQVQDLSRVQDLLESVLTDRHQYYYVLIDRLDENWVEQKLRYRLVMTLIETVKEISRVPNIKVVVAIRRDLLDRVFRMVRNEGAGFQEEKYQSRYLPLHWEPDQLIQVLDKRVTALVVSRYQKKQTIRHSDLMPERVGKTPIEKFITDRAMRPRDVIDLFNKCIEMADGKACVTLDALSRAEGEYSRQRMRALGDEWHETYPGLLDFVSILKEQPSSFALSQIDENAVAELCLKSAIDHSDEKGMLREGAWTVANASAGTDEFRRTLFMVFYRVGLVGLKLETFERSSWRDEVGQSVSSAEIDSSTGVTVHPTYWRALGIDGRKGGDGRR